jgi:6,7-dimethyl-8-ribityllumazine synthase
MAATQTRVALLVAQFNKPITDAMAEVATAELQERGVVVSPVIRVPGCYEIPLVADLLMQEPGVDAIVALGYIEKGETLHGEVMGHVVHDSLVRSQILHRKPAGLGIIGPGATPEQAEVRKVACAQAAARAALRNLEILRQWADLCDSGRAGRGPDVADGA